MGVLTPLILRIMRIVMQLIKYHMKDLVSFDLRLLAYDLKIGGKVIDKCDVLDFDLAQIHIDTT